MELIDCDIYEIISLKSAAEIKPVTNIELLPGVCSYCYYLYIYDGIGKLWELNQRVQKQVVAILNGEKIVAYELIYYCPKCKYDWSLGDWSREWENFESIEKFLEMRF